MSLLALSGTNSVSGGYEIDNSCMFDWNGTNTAGNGQSYMYDTSWTGTPTSTTTGCFSTWFKNSLSNSTNSLGVASFVNNYSDGNNRSYIMGDWGSGGNFVFGQKVSGSWNFRVVSNALYRDPAAHYHFFAVWDTSNSTESERIRLYVNGERITSLSDEIYPSQNQECYIVSKEDFSVGRAYSSVYGNFTHGYMAETHFVDGTAYAPTDFGEFDEDSGIWKPKQVSVSYGNKGFYLDYKDASNLGNDASGNNRDLTLSDIDSSHQSVDTPTNNFCTINPIVATDSTISEGATKFKNHGVNGWETFVATMGAGTSGKWYAEFQVVDHGSGDNFIGISPIDDPDLNKGFGTSFAYLGSDTSLDESVGYYAAGGNRYIGGGTASYGNSYTTTDIMSVAVDMDNGKLYFAKNGTWQNSGDPTSGSTGTGALDVRGATKPQTLSGSVYYANHAMKANYGGYTTISISSPQSDANGYGTFEYAPPSGYYALCSRNLSEFG